MRTLVADLFMSREELKELEEVYSEEYGEKVVVLPTFLKPGELDIGYECDRKACLHCHPETCSHTTDIRHAKNFMEIGNERWMEKLPHKKGGCQ